MNKKEQTEFLPYQGGSGWQCPTEFIRYVVRNGERVLQQLWKDPNSFTGTWRDVPIEEETDGENVVRGDPN